MSLPSRTAARALACAAALFAAAFAAGVAVRRGDAHVAPPVAAIRPVAGVAGLGPATALPVLRDVAPRAAAIARRRAAQAVGSRAAGTEVAARRDASRRRAARPAIVSRPVIVAARPAPVPQVPFTPVRHTVPAVRPAPAAPAPATAAPRPTAAAGGGGSVTFFSDGGG